jgi:hypothetical protein
MVFVCDEKKTSWILHAECKSQGMETNKGLKNLFINARMNLKA